MWNHEDEYLLRRLAHLLRENELPWQDWMDGFLRDLERNPENVTLAIDLCKVSRDTVYRYRRRNPEFARRWAEIVDEGEPEIFRAPRREPPVSPPHRTRPCTASTLPRRHRPNLHKAHRRQGRSK